MIACWIEERGKRSAWCRMLTAFTFGFAGALAFQPTAFFPILALSFPALIILLRTAPDLRAAFLTGWSFAFGYFLLGLYWIAAALFVDIHQFWWAVPLAVAGVPAICATYYGLAAAAAKRIGLDGLSGVLTFALCWFAADYARGHLLTGFPWNLESAAWSNVLPIMQSLSLFGSYGLTLLTVLLVSLLAAVTGLHHTKDKIITLFICAVLCFAYLWGDVRLQNDAGVTPSYVRVVQPNVEQYQKWEMSSREKHFDNLLAMTSAPAAHPLNLIVWPETASTFYLEEDEPHRRALAGALQEGSYALTGLIRRSVGHDGKPAYANSLIIVDRSGRIADSYDKFHLVPFGEYIPFRKVLSVRTLANLGVDFTAGQGPRTLHLDSLPAFSPLICYEAIFPGEVMDHEDRPQLLINITNDGWYGKTAGPYQHFAAARSRAIEEGLPLVRSANTGISAVIDPYGRIMAKLALGEAGFVDAAISQAITPTPYSRYGDLPVGIMFLLIAVFAFTTRKGNAAR